MGHASPSRPASRGRDEAPGWQKSAPADTAADTRQTSTPPRGSLVALHSDYDSLEVAGYARPIFARALSVVNIHFMRGRAAFRFRSQAAISRCSRFGLSLLRSRHW